MTWLEGAYITLRPSFGDNDAIYAYRTEIAWDAAVSSLVFREGERTDADYTQFGEVAVPNQSGFIYLVTNRHGQHRLITVSRPTILGEMYGIITTLLAGRGSLLTPIAAPIAYLPTKLIPGADARTDFRRRPQLRGLSRASEAHHRRAVRDISAGELKRKTLSP